MIEVTDKHAKITGIEPEILGELSMLINTIKNDIDEDKIRFAVDLGFCDKDERDDLLLNTVKDKLKEVIDELELDEDEKATERKDIDKLLEKLRKRNRE